MTQISRIFIFISLTMVILIACEYGYVRMTKSLTQETLDKKALFASSVGLPDLSLVTEARYVRHRSLSDVFSLFGDGPELREYFPSTFVYHHSPLFKMTPTQIQP
jgi:hypothetical protein